jgi:hypothetical protein
LAVGCALLSPKPIASQRFASIPSNYALVRALVGGIVPALVAISHRAFHQLFHNHRQILLVIKRQISRRKFVDVALAVMRQDVVNRRMS